MDKKLEDIALHGRYDREYTGDEIYESLDKEAVEYNRRVVEAKYSGEKAHFTYRCPICGAEHTTKGRYKIGRDPVERAKQNLRHAPSNFLTDLIENTVGEIPWIGNTLEDRRERKLRDRRGREEERFIDVSRLEAFEAEMMDTFVACKTCGRYGCSECVVDGLCQDCRD